jgi:small GTP-binding protein
MLDHDEDDLRLKIALVGAPSIGKTSLLGVLAHDEYRENRSTIGVDFMSIPFQVPYSSGEPFAGKKLRFVVWDTAGQERYRSLAAAYYRGAVSVILCYDISNLHSFEVLETYYQEAYNHEVTSFVVCGLKMDATRAVSRSMGLEFASSHNAAFIELSSRTRDNIPLFFPTVLYGTQWEMGRSLGPLLLSAGFSRMMPLKSVAFDAHVVDAMATINTTMTFQNNLSVPSEIKFFFPVSPSSIITKVAIIVDGCRTVGTLQSNQAAQNVYDDAIASGRTATMVERQQERTAINLGIIHPQKSVSVEFCHFEELPCSDRRLCFSYSTGFMLHQVQQSPSPKHRFLTPTSMW